MRSTRTESREARTLKWLWFGEFSAHFSNVFSPVAAHIRIRLDVFVDDCSCARERIESMHVNTMVRCVANISTCMLFTFRSSSLSKKGHNSQTYKGFHITVTTNRAGRRHALAYSISSRRRLLSIMMGGLKSSRSLRNESADPLYVYENHMSTRSA